MINNIRLNGIVKTEPISAYANGIFKYGFFKLAVGGSSASPVAVSDIYCYKEEMLDGINKGNPVVVEGEVKEASFDVKAISIVVGTPIG